MDWWRVQPDIGQFRLSYLFQTGEVDSDTADAWAAEVWEATYPGASI